MRDFMARGGKRTRAQLVRHAWRAVGGADAGPAHARMVRLGASLELIQACAVVHDDLIDGADRRRDAPTLHRACATEHRGQRWSGDSDRYGVAQAVLAGDLALARADDLVLDVCCEDPAAGRRIRGLWRTMREEMVTGQRLELRLQAERSGSAEAALSVARLKSGGYSVQRPLELGAALAGAGPGQMSALGGFGARIGLAFQLVDDFRDVFCDEAGLGKRPGSDLAEGKRTYMVLRAMEAAESGHPAGHGMVIRAAFGDPDLDDGGLGRVREAMRAVGTEAEILGLVARLRREGRALLHAADLDPSAVADLVELTDRMTDPGSGGTAVAGTARADSGPRTGGEA
ncbi:polyprenyl synthetase family protein [Kitasatospora sp. NBC_01539]|uniref:polyprenyl synthetase family protein n=1 Tax=Kitasatospora sp. NBC_01539 TaxID=2903577 RepID=UPI0038600F0D